MNQPRLSNPDILRTAAVITAVDEGMPAKVQEMGTLIAILRMLDPSFYIVYWPNGPTGVAYGDPAEQRTWNELLISTYRQGEANVMGPVVPGAE